MSVILHLTGPSCSGKSTLIDAMRACSKRVGSVEVGKLFRAKHPESYFAGQAAPAHTQDEAWDMYVEGVKECMRVGNSLIVVDGQPRDIKQSREIVGFWKYPHRSEFLALYAEHDERVRRCKADVTPRDLEARMQRITNDYRNCYTVMSELLLREQCIRVIDTTKVTDMAELARNLVRDYIG